VSLPSRAARVHFYFLIELFFNHRRLSTDFFACGQRRCAHPDIAESV
jgi:hypothetical protein